MASPFSQSPEVATCCTKILGNVPTLGKYIFGTRFLNDEPETAEAIVRALMRTNRTYLQGDYHDDPEVMTILSEALGAPEESIASVSEYVLDPELGIDLDFVTEAQKIWIAGEGLDLEQPIDPSRFVDTTPVETCLLDEAAGRGPLPEGDSVGERCVSPAITAPVATMAAPASSSASRTSPSSLLAIRGQRRLNGLPGEAGVDVGTGVEQRPHGGLLLG